MKFSDYKNQEIKTSKEDSKTKNIDQLDAYKMFDKYSSMSYEEILNEFIKETQIGKANGSINKESLNSIKKTLNPYLDEKSKKKLDDIIEGI